MRSDDLLFSNHLTCLQGEDQPDFSSTAKPPPRLLVVPQQTTDEGAGGGGSGLWRDSSWPTALGLNAQGTICLIVSSACWLRTTLGICPSPRCTKCLPSCNTICWVIIKPWSIEELHLASLKKQWALEFPSSSNIITKAYPSIEGLISMNNNNKTLDMALIVWP